MKNSKLKSKDFFDVERNPAITFKSTKIVPQDKACGRASTRPQNALVSYAASLIEADLSGANLSLADSIGADISQAMLRAKTVTLRYAFTQICSNRQYDASWP